MKVKSNTLVKILVPSALALAVLIGIKSCQPDTPVTGSGQDNLSQSINDLDPGELKSLGIEGDTPADTLRTLIGTMKTVRDRQAELIAQNEKLLEENAQLRNRQQNVSGQIQSAVASVRQEAESQQRALQQEQQSLMRRLDSLGETLTASGGQPAQGSGQGDIPLGLGLDTGGSGLTVKDGLLWAEPQDAQPAEPGRMVNGQPAEPGRMVNGQPAKPAFPTSFLEDNAITRQKAELDRVAKNQRTLSGTVDGEAHTEPAYTIPENATLVGSQAMTALLGRVPIDGKVTDPYPFKVVVGKDNLTANGIELPDVEGAVISGSATGDWTLSCVRGDITSITFVFTDGTIRTVPKPADRTDGGSQANSGQNARNNGGSLGWISDESGIPCISGERKTNAGTYLPTLFALTAAASAGDAMSQSQYTAQNNGYGITSSLSGDAGKAALGSAIGGGFKDVADWVKSRYGQTFDAVYVPPGQKVAVHISRQIPVDYESQGRRVNYGFSLTEGEEGGLE
ncbi:TPA: TIGR03752 family integrating conjugative element protein [Proteus mirabilis]|nr:TIGR03752 family integrating conjugative element protein [Escherichia coli]MDH8609873.1 TIGR03752 family integrating conjugative element protein [Klebsiella pneumoniae]HAU4277532.1 TIGR03752 family integrating conjugative element protein [Proteus mirabilis]HCT9340852.1 TIGR03752 family integrating conjugative element protein [Proteus mirabilis]HDS6295627.1 TIGR03752 family integrating conjugative element protein [Klebsiella pneumoniae subsp. pneumoniae]